MTDEWPMRFLEAWLAANPQPMNEHGQLLGPLPNEFLRAYYIEHEVRSLRERLEAMTFDELVERAGDDFKAFLRQNEKLAQLRELAASATEARRRDAQARDIERHCRDLKSRGAWERGSAKVVAARFDCSVRHVQNIFSKI